MNARDFFGGCQGPIFGPIPNEQLVGFFPKFEELFPNGSSLIDTSFIIFGEFLNFKTFYMSYDSKRVLLRH